MSEPDWLELIADKNAERDEHIDMPSAPLTLFSLISSNKLVDNHRSYVSDNAEAWVVCEFAVMKIVDHNFNILSERNNGRARGAAEARKIADAIAPISKKVNSTTLLYGLSATCHCLSHREVKPGDYALGRSEMLQEASDIAWAIATVADRADIQGLLSAYIEILRQLD